MEQYNNNEHDSNMDADKLSYQKYMLPSAIKNDEDGYNFFCGLYNSLKSLGNKILVDFSLCTQFDGNLCAIMGAIFDLLSNEGVEITLKAPLDDKVKNALGCNSFFLTWNLNTKYVDKENYIKYRRFDVNATQQFKDYIDAELIHKQKFPVHTELVGKYLVDNIYEIYTNATMHGHASYVYACGEYDGKTHVLHMSIVDCGRTIVENVNEFLIRREENAQTPTSAIHWAFVEGHTTKSDTGGLGMAQIKQFMSLNDGTLDVISGKGWISISGDKESEHILNEEFPGTIVHLHFNFDDTKNYLMASEQRIDNNDLL